MQTKCFNRNLRCTLLDVCLIGEEKKSLYHCMEYPDEIGVYAYWSIKVPLTPSSSFMRRKRSVSDVYHWAVMYRGFTYEFGISYGIQELDINDPNYKYFRRGLRSIDREEGRSRCTRDQVRNFTYRWIEANPKYKLFTSNCQDYARALMKELANNCRGRVNSGNDEEKESLKAHCAINNSISSDIPYPTRFIPSTALLQSSAGITSFLKLKLYSYIFFISLISFAISNVKWKHCDPNTWAFFLQFNSCTHIEILFSHPDIVKTFSNKTR